MQTFKDVLDHFHDFLEESSYLEVLPCRWGCPVCLHSFQDAKKAFLRRADIRQQTKDVCTYCQTRYGFDYYVQPAAAHRDGTRRKVRTYVPASSH